MTSPRRAPLAEAERTALSQVVGRLRERLDRELRRSLEGTYGIGVGRTEPEDESRLNLGPDQLLARRELVGLWHVLDRRADLLVRQAAFTHVNRLIAIRIAEALGRLPESIARGRRSSGFRQLLEVAPLLGSDDDAGYWTYLQLCADELAHDVPRLFDPRNPLVALRPPPSAIDDLVALISGDALGQAHDDGPAWAAPDTLGWTYQFFNSDEERGEMRRANAQPQDSWELAVRNQFFTPDYVVGFLVHNSLGRRLVEAGFDELTTELEYLVDPPPASGAPLDLSAVRVLDPAVGSGHFLLGAYDVLERAWELSGVDPGEAAPAIVGSLWGIDIDPRAAQVAAAAIVFRARRHRPDGDLPAPKVICARAVSGGREARQALLTSVDASQWDFLSELIDGLDRAPELGSLLKVDELLTGETARRMAFGGGRQRVSRTRTDPSSASLLDSGIESGALDVASLVEGVLARAQAVADQVTSTPEERVLAADGGDALRLVEALSQRYDAVLMNPPFGEPIPDTKPYLKAAYPWIPTRDYNLLAAFVGRGLELSKPDGYLGAITSRAGMFLTTFERWREEVLLGNDLIVLADLGHKVMHGALVEAAAYVVRPGQARHDRPAAFIRLLREPPTRRPEALRDACAHLRGGEADERVFHVRPSAFDAIPGSPMAYWMSPDIRRLFTDFPPLEGHGADIRQGLATGDDFRFVRAFWEVDPARIARSREETFEAKRWVPFAKGGEYSPFWADIHLVVDFERNGELLRASPGSVIRNPQYYFRPGLTWPERTTSGFGIRVLPAGSAFSHVGHGAFPYDDAIAALGYLTSRVAQALVLLFMGSAEETMSGSPAKRYAVGVIQRLPWPMLEIGPSERAALTRLVQHRASQDLHNETARRFVAPVVPMLSTLANEVTRRVHGALDEAVENLSDSQTIEAAVVDACKLSDRANTYIDQELGPHPASYPRDDLDEEELGRLFRQTIDATIDDLVRSHGGSRSISNLTFIADRRLEVLAHGLEVHPSAIPRAVRKNGWLPIGTIASAAASLFSYLVGCAFGRWDVRIGRAPATAPMLSGDPFAPVPVCPPGQLVGPDGLPALAVPPGYPLALTDHQVLVDEVGHPVDLVTAAEAAAAALVDDPRATVDELTELLNVPDLRTYLRKRFFKEHLSRYSKSRRKAPIYWPLTIPSRSWTVWVYAPTLSREAIYAVAGHAERRHNAAEAEIRRLESAQLQASVPGSAGHDPAMARAIAGRLDAERRIAEELRSFRKVVDRVAGSGWKPDLDDGIVVCAAPFAEALLDWPKDPADTRGQLRAGKLPWTTAHRWRDSL